MERFSFVFLVAGVLFFALAFAVSGWLPMLVVSDLDVIVKSSRNELFLFAQNMRTGKPLAGASVLISDGSEVFAEELTGDDGVLQKSYDQLKSVEQPKREAHE